MEGNKLTEISENLFSSWTMLTEFNASKNLLNGIPDSIGGLSRLIRLDLHQNKQEYKKFFEWITESHEAMKLIVVMASHCYLVGSSGELFIEYLVRHCALTDNNRGDLDILNKRVEVTFLPNSCFSINKCHLCTMIRP
ncbi:hypothetical protein AHAS_Ahas17G0166000 [Arachis hypogaea]